MGTARRTLLRGIRLYGAVLPRALVLAFASILVGAFALWLYAVTLGPRLYSAIADRGTDATSNVIVTIVTLLPLIAIFAVLGLVWAGSVVTLADRVSRQEPVAVGRALALATRRAGWAFLTILAWASGSVIALALAPLALMTGLGGLAVHAVMRSDRRPRWLPRLTTLVVLAVPFGAAIAVALRCSDAVAQVWIEGRKPLAALRASWSATAGRTARIAVVLGTAVLAAAALAEAGAGIASMLDAAPATVQLVRIGVQLIVGALPLVALVLLHADAPGGPGAQRPNLAPRKHIRASRIAGATAALLLAHAALAPSGPAEAATYPAPEVTVWTAPGSGIVAGNEFTIASNVFSPDAAEGDPQPTGTVSLSIDGGAAIGPIAIDPDSGNASFPFPSGMAAGSYEAVVTYSGDGSYPSANGSVSFTITGATSVTLTVADDALDFGDNLDATADVSGVSAGGTVVFTAFPTVGDAVDLGSATTNSEGEARVSFPMLPPGDYLIGATYQGDAGGGAASAASVSVTVLPLYTTTTMSLSPASSLGSPSPAGGTVVANVTVTASGSALVPQGSIEIYPDGGGDLLASGALMDGEVELEMILPSGAPVVRATFVADPGFYGSFTTEQQYVAGVSSITSLDVDETSVFGSDVTLTATVAATETVVGGVDFYMTADGGLPTWIGYRAVNLAGVASLDVSGLDAGDYSFTASFAGSSTVGPSDSTPQAHTVTAAEASVVVNITNATPYFDQTVLATITVTSPSPGAGTPTGTLTLLRDDVELATGVTLAAGEANYSFPAGDPGAHELIARFVPDSNFASAEGSVGITTQQRSVTVHVGGDPARSTTYGVTEHFEGGVTASGTLTKPTGIVQLYADGYQVGSVALAADGGFSIDTDEIPALAHPGTRVIVAKYLGDVNFPATNSDGSVSIHVAKAHETPAVTLGSGEIGIGGTYALKATLPDLGEGASGTLTFTVTVDGVPTVIGPIAVTGGIAQTPYTVVDSDTFVSAAYSGDANFEAATSSVAHFVATRSAALVELTVQPADDPDVFAYGNVFEIVAKITLAGGLETNGLVDFKTVGGMTIAENVPTTYFPSQGIGVARVEVCAGDDAGCPGDVPAIGIFDQEFIAKYPEGSLNMAGTSNTVPYSMTGAPTSLVLVSNPPTASPGGGVLLEATVTNLLGGTPPTGVVSFYGLTTTSEGIAETYVGEATLYATTGSQAMATMVATVGNGVDELIWPAEGVMARYFDASHTFGSSHDSQPLTITRVPTSLSVAPATATLGGTSDVTITLSHDPGVSDNFTGKVELFLDGSSTPVCTKFPVGSANSVTCSVTWTSIAGHSLAASFAGDVIYAPSTSPTVTVGVGKATPNLGAATSVVSPIALTETTVTWVPGALTGTVTVTADGTVWCTTSVASGSCTGQFTNASATGSPIQIFVRYSGDTNYNQVEQTLSRTVIGCRLLDVYSIAPARGSVAVTPAPSCGTGGYPVGTIVTATATPVAPNVFAHWLAFTPTSSSLVPVATTASTAWTVTNDTWTWVRAADFRLPCVTVTQKITGQGYLLASRPTDCTTLDGKAGYIQGGTVTFQPIGTVNADYGIRDTFYGFGNLPAGVSAGTDATGYPKLTVTLGADIAIPATFGPRCVQVKTIASPADAGIVALTTPPNCASPAANGYLPRTTVTATASGLKANFFVSGWTTTQADTPTLPAGTTATLTLGTADVVLTADAIACYPVTVVADSPRNIKNRPVGSIALTPAANCPDGSGRYVAGTDVTAIPSTLSEGAFFVGWDGATNATVGSIPPPGPQPSLAKTYTVNGPLTVTGSFFLRDVCSQLQEFDRNNVVTFAPTGCGPGYYYDLMTQLKNHVGPELADEIWTDADRTTLTATKREDTNLDVYASVSGDTRECFGIPAGTPDGPTENTGWRSLGKMGSGPQDCLVGGSIAFRFEQCQTLDPDVAIYREGDESGTEFDKSSLPAVLYVPTAAGNFAPMSPQAFAWVAAQPLELDGDDFVPADQAPGACKDSGHAYQPDMTLMIGADSPAAGITFLGWTSDEEVPLVEDNPALIVTDDSRPVIPLSAAYSLTCYHVTFGEGITIEGDAPRCPGFADEDNMFIGGTGIMIRAAQHVGSRTFGDWTSGVVRATTVKDGTTGERTAFAFVTGNMTVAAKYPTEGERWESGMANAGKVVLGITAVAAPVLLGIACPPCGVALATVALGSLIASSIPGGDDVAAFFDLINPSKLLDCTATWGFGNTKTEKETAGQPEPGDVLSIATKEKKILTYIKPPPTAAQLAEQAAKAAANTSKTTARLATLKVVGKSGLQLAAFGYGLYDAGLFATDLGYQTEGELRDTAAFAQCMDNAARLVT
jgi:hypothetical protein